MAVDTSMDWVDKNEHGSAQPQGRIAQNIAELPQTVTRPGGARMTPAATRSLVMWSGGLDSTYALVRLLAESDDQVIAHHIHYLRRTTSGTRADPRCAYEANAVSTLLPLLREQQRPFEFSESRLDLSALDSAANDTTTAMFFAAQVALSYGLTPFDRIVFGVNADIDNDWQPETYAYAFRRLVTVRMLKAVWESDEVPYLYVWNPRPGRSEEMGYLSGEIAALTASCRRPAIEEHGFARPQFQPCGECSGCASRPELCATEA